ncbi:LysM peptidoglycan-binding domain-containing protein [Photobacterium kagoshimensis]|uniref:LysM peptidoglycan-binding domain-containing protein n=1 Tax=Photobacterium kagoshimensis TaxID=2910242 RepID=UPI003D11C02B
MKPLSFLFSCVLTVAVCIQPSLASNNSNSLVLNENIPNVYTVKKGDTLWDISNHFLATPWLWPKLWQANPEIENPHLIYPGDKLYLVWVDGQPRLQRKPSKVIKLSPTIKVTRSPITTLQSSLVLPYLVEHRLLSDEALAKAPRVLGSDDQRKQLSAGDVVWADTLLPVGEAWWVYRPIETYSRQGSKSVTVLKEVAKLTVLAQQDETSTLALQSYRQEINLNDVLLPAPALGASADLHFSPANPPTDIAAQVMGAIGGQSYIATSEVVVLDKGHLDALQAGHVLQLYHPATEVEGSKGSYQYKQSPYVGKQFQLAPRGIGEVMVIRAYDAFSLAVVLRSTEPFSAGVSARSPQLTQ